MRNDIKRMPLTQENAELNLAEHQGHIYLFDDDIFDAELIKTLDAIGCHVTQFSEFEAFESACSNALPAIILIAIKFQNGLVIGANTIDHLKKQSSIFPPVIVISPNEDLSLIHISAPTRPY